MIDPLKEALDKLKATQDELLRLKTQYAESQRREKKLESELKLIKGSWSFRIGSRMVQLIKRPYLLFWWPIKLVYKVLKRFKQRIAHKLQKNNALKTHNLLTRLASKIPESNGSEYYIKCPLRIAIVTDDYMYNYYKDAVNLCYVGPENYKSILDSKIDAFLILSSWSGMENGDWEGIGSFKTEKRKTLIEAIEYAKSKNIKVIFQSIEDPTHYKVFLDYAVLSDYIFTASAETVDQYKQDTRNQNVYTLLYGVNPLLHNPIGFHGNSPFKKGEVLFAGSWYKHFKERCDDTEQIFEGSISAKRKLVIADRCYYRDTENRKFPEKYQKYTIPPFEHILLQRVHKLFDMSINLNTIKNSKTMCAMRAYELQAIGNLILSNYSLALALKFPNIFFIYEKGDVEKHLKNLTDDQVYRLQVEGIRNVMSDNTVYDRLNEIFEYCNIDFSFRDKRVLVVCDTYSEKITKQYNEQTYPFKDLCVISDLTAQKARDYDYITFWHDKNQYDIHYLTDMMNAFKYTDVGFVTKEADVQYDFIDHAKDRYRTVFSLARLDLDTILSSTNVKAKGFALDKYEINDKNRISYKPDIPDSLVLYKSIDELIQTIPHSNGCGFYHKSDVNIAIITDEFSYNTYKDAVNLHYVSPDNYASILNGSISALLFITCWRGLKDNEWAGVWQEGSDKQRVLFDLIAYAKKLGIKFIFQSKEDPPDYEKYLSIARRADVIFTSAIEMVDHYKSDTGNTNVFPLDYGINPLIHNPLGIQNKKEIDCPPINDAVFFSGSWYDRFPERCKDSTTLFDGVIDSGKKLLIADRNYFLNSNSFKFPQKYQKQILPAIDYQKLQQVQKLFDWAINLNSVKTSQTMCAARTYELQALGNLLISNDSQSVARLFPNVFIIQKKEDAVSILGRLSKEEIYRLKVKGIRLVMSAHTVYDKLNILFEKAGINDTFIAQKILVLCEKVSERIQNDFNDQTYPFKKLSTIDEYMNTDLTEYPYVTLFSEGNKYGSCYIEDMINGFKYTNCDFIAKRCDKEYDYVTEIIDPYSTVIDTTKISVKEYLSGKRILATGLGLDPFGLNDTKD